MDERAAELGWWDEIRVLEMDAAIVDFGDPMAGLARLRASDAEDGEDEAVDAADYLSEAEYHDQADEMSDGEFERRNRRGVVV